jgi:hypothetical protein
MRVISGAGEFELSVERVEVRDRSLVMIGKMGVWEAETIIEEGELGHLLGVSLRPRILGWALARPFVALWRRLRGRGAREEVDPSQRSGDT